MIQLKKISYYDLRAESASASFPKLIGRREELERLERVLNRRIRNNCFIVGPSGIGKTTLAWGLARRIAQNPKYQHRRIVQFGASHIPQFSIPDAEAHHEQALKSIPPHTIIFIDDVGRAIPNNHTFVERIRSLYEILLKRPDVQMVATIETKEYASLLEEQPAFARLSEVIALKTQAQTEYVRILETKLAKLNQNYHILAPSMALESIVKYGEHFPTLGQLPRSAISILDECLAYAASEGKKILTEDIVEKIVAGKTGVPVERLGQYQMASLKNLEETLNAGIVHQETGVKKIAAALTRAKLGMRNPNRPLGSFLILGPSGVGKTETAKLVAKTMFGRPESFIRFDMSEFSQEHTVQRLLGAPPGYVGYENGGALTSAIKAEPHSLLLLDEIEKAHAKVFDIFLQVLDDGRITSGRNETVDARNTIIMATSNVAVPEIMAGLEAGEDIHSQKFLEETIMPSLTAHFRLEFLNRFDSILVFNPLSLPDLVKIAKLEIEKVEKRLAHYNVNFEMDPEILEKRITSIAEPRFGARPIKRFIEETCETLLVESLLREITIKAAP